MVHASHFFYATWGAPAGCQCLWPARRGAGFIGGWTPVLRIEPGCLRRRPAAPWRRESSNAIDAPPRTVMSWSRVLILLLGAWATAVGAADTPGTQSRELALARSTGVGFTLLAPESTGVQFTNWISAQRHLTNQILLNGSGAALGDADGDGLCDVYLCRLEGANALYRNLGDWKFQDVTEAAGVGCADVHATGAAFADLDGDGDLDLVVNTVGGGTHVFFNHGKGRFELRARLNGDKGGTSLAFADVDGDGFLDFYVANYRTSGLMDMPNARATFKQVEGRVIVETVDGRPTTEPELKDRFVIGPRGIEEQGEADALFRNQRGTNFTPVPFTGGAFLDEEGRALGAPPLDWGLAAMFRDINGDTLPDLYVCNDFQSEDRFWINQGAGRFRLIDRLAQRKTSQ